MRGKLTITALLVALGTQAFAQDGMSLQSDGSTVVISVLAIIFIGMFVYLLFTERKLARMEKELKEIKENKK